jgi:hypothetical protein
MGCLSIYELFQKEQEKEYSKMESGNAENYRRNGTADVSYIKETII